MADQPAGFPGSTVVRTTGLTPNFMILKEINKITQKISLQIEKKCRNKRKLRVSLKIFEQNDIHDFFFECQSKKKL